MGSHTQHLLVILGVQRDLKLVIIVRHTGVGQALGLLGLLGLVVHGPAAGAVLQALLLVGGDGERLPRSRDRQLPLLGQLGGDLLWLDPAREGEPLLELLGDVGRTSLGLGLVLGQHDQDVALGLDAELLKKDSELVLMPN